MDRIGLTFDEFVELRLKPTVGVFHETVTERKQVFPMNMVTLCRHLWSRGYDCRPAMLELLAKDGVAAPADLDTWTRADVDAAADHFEQCQIFTPYAGVCQTFGCRYADFLRPLCEAAERESQKYGLRVPADDSYFVMHRVPPRSVMGVDGSLVDIKPAVISFTLCDDVRERLERGEDV